MKNGEKTCKDVLSLIWSLLLRIFQSFSMIIAMLILTYFQTHVFELCSNYVLNFVLYSFFTVFKGFFKSWHFCIFQKITPRISAREMKIYPLKHKKTFHRLQKMTMWFFVIEAKSSQDWVSQDKCNFTWRIWFMLFG